MHLNMCYLLSLYVIPKETLTYVILAVMYWNFHSSIAQNRENKTKQTWKIPHC